jgi:hypothetical protein
MATETARRWTTGMWSLNELMVLDRLLREADRAIIMTDSRTQWQHPRRWTPDPAGTPDGTPRGLPIEDCPEHIKLAPKGLALVWRSEAHKRPLDYHATYCTSVVRAELGMGLRLVCPWHRAVTTSNSYPALLLAAFEGRGGGGFHWSVRHVTYERGRELARAAADWEDEEVIEEPYCRMHDLFDCPYAHGPDVSDLNY